MVQVGPTGGDQANYDEKVEPLKKTLEVVCTFNHPIALGSVTASIAEPAANKFAHFLPQV